MTTRLNDRIRKIILQRLLDYRFKKEQDELAEEWKTFEGAIYEDIYPKKIRSAMAALPDGYFSKGGSFRLSFGGEVSDVYISMKKPVATCHISWNSTTKIYLADDPLTLEWRRLADKKRELSDKRGKASAAANGILQNCYTVKQLIDNWPEAAPFVADFQDTKKSVALMVNPKDLNAHFNL
jgi:Nucleotide modification associated domain 5